MIPSKSLALTEEKTAAGCKISKEQGTVMACSNITGTHKLKLVLKGNKKLNQIDMLNDITDLKINP